MHSLDMAQAKTERARAHNVVIPMSPDEREQLRSLAEADDLDMAKLVRRWVREAWAARQPKT